MSGTSSSHGARSLTANSAWSRAPRRRVMHGNDTGHLAELLTAAALRWPDVIDHKQLLLRLAQEGHHAPASAEVAVEVGRLLSGEPWS